MQVLSTDEIDAAIFALDSYLTKAKRDGDLLRDSHRVSVERALQKLRDADSAPRSIDEVLRDLDLTSDNFDRGWRVEPPTMAALTRRVARDIRAALAAISR